ncbi:hypothetical protein ABZY44_29650 [Streptomyces sp. NPDC006544]|uniref:hypothetical protein n=1 Tax=Streptomyces sp. NPDC006544 TaxID=3154583 RepID=UPI0033BEF9E3
MMIMMRAAITAAALALSLPATAAHATEQPAAPAPAPAVVPQVLPIGGAVSALPLATEDRTSYQRTSFRHWNTGAKPSDGCNTRVISTLRAMVELFLQRTWGIVDCVY